MISGSCFFQLAALVVTFKGPDSRASFMGQSISDQPSTFFIQFKTAQANTRIVKMSIYDNQTFTVDIQNGFLRIMYNLTDAGYGTESIDSHLVNTSEWFLLNISSEQSKTYFRLTKRDQAASTLCTAKNDRTMNIALLGKGFSTLFRKAGLTVGGETNSPSLESFEGCIGSVNLGNHALEFLNKSSSQKPSYFVRQSSGISAGCPCPTSPCGKNGIYLWDREKATCACECSIGYHGDKCQHETSSDDDEVDNAFIYLVVGVTVGALVVVSCIMCCIFYFRRTRSSVFGTYNPKTQECVQGQQLEVAFKVPVPEKLI